MPVAYTPTDLDTAPAKQYSLGTSATGAYPARTSEGEFAVVIELKYRPPSYNFIIGCIQLRTFSEVIFETEGARRTSPALVIDCGDRSLLPTFVTVCAEIVRHCGPAFPIEAVMDVLRDWSDALESTTPLTPTAERHLWGNLQVLLRCTRHASSMHRWRPWKGSALDFVGGGIGIVCKTTLDHRRHILSMAQLRTTDSGNITTYLASLVADLNSDGETLPELIERISDQLEDSHDFTARLGRAGYRFSDAAHYQQRLVLVESWFVLMSAVPRVRCADPGVSHIRFEVDRRFLEPHKLNPEAEVALFDSLGMLDILDMEAMHSYTA